MDVRTFLGEIRGSVANLMSRELHGLDAMKVQTTTWILFKIEVEDGDGNIIKVDTVNKAFNSRMMEVFQRSNLEEVIDEMFTHVSMQIEKPCFGKL